MSRFYQPLFIAALANLLVASFTGSWLRLIFGGIWLLFVGIAYLRACQAEDARRQRGVLLAEIERLLREQRSG